MKIVFFLSIGLFLATGVSAQQKLVFNTDTLAAKSVSELTKRFRLTDRQQQQLLQARKEEVACLDKAVRTNDSKKESRSTAVFACSENYRKQLKLIFTSAQLQEFEVYEKTVSDSAKAKLLRRKG